MKGLFEKRVESALANFYKTFGVNTALIPTDIILQSVDEAHKDLAKEVYGMATIHDIPGLQKKFEKWFGSSEGSESEEAK